jgi:NAD(P)-dependent dehydrogenase (short-subunit alcohol dehydrogenase family)
MTTIVMTGGTSGLGKFALRYLLKIRDMRILLGARHSTLKETETIPLDLASLDSVRSFAFEINKRIGNDKINALVFNAGIQIIGRTKTIDGFETTFAVNHLAHYLLLRLLLPKLADNARIILTTSGTYDPAEKTIIPPPLHANAKFLAYPELDKLLEKDPITAGGRAYSSSKLCVILTARALAANPDVIKNKWKIIAYDPGPTPGTGLVRNNKLVVRIVWKLLSFPFLRELFPKMNSVKAAGETLAKLAVGKISIPDEYIYTALRKGKLTYPELSDLAKRDDLVINLWNESATLAGLKE